MNSRWLDLDDEDLGGTLRFGLRLSRDSRLKSWGSLNRVDQILDFAAPKSNFFENDKLWGSVLKDSFIGRSAFARGRLFSDDSDDSFFGKARSLRHRLLRDRTMSESETEDGRVVRKPPVKRFTRFDSKTSEEGSDAPEKSSSSSSAFTDSYSFVDVTNDLNKSPSGRSGSDRTGGGSRKPSFQGNVTFPMSSSSNVSEASFSDKTNSNDSVVTEKSTNCSSLSEKLPDGTNKTKVENMEKCMRKSKSGSVMSEATSNDTLVTEQSAEKTCEKSSKKTSYLEKSNTGSSLSQESSSEKVVSCDKSGSKTVEQRTSTETFSGKRAFRLPPNKSTFYDELDSSSFQHYVPLSRTLPEEDADKTPVMRRRVRNGLTASEKISKLMDEAAEQDNLFKIPSRLQHDIDDLLCGRRRLSGFFPGPGNAKVEAELSWTKFNELKRENENLQQENAKLQSIIQDVTSVNKRWQRYNNDRRLYVQKLLSTIQDLQEQINLISEKTAFQNCPRPDGEETQLDAVQRRHKEELDQLKLEHREHITVLELQIKSHKDDWDAERKDRRKTHQEKEELGDRVKELTREVKFLKTVLQEEKTRKGGPCVRCRSQTEDSAMFPPSLLQVSRAFVPKTFRTSVHVPYNLSDVTSADSSFMSEEDVSKDGLEAQDSCSFLSDDSQCEDWRAEKETVMIEDNSGMRLMVTEHKELKPKSILKKERRLCLSSHPFPPESLGQRNITCPEPCGLSVGFEKDGLARVASFSPEPCTPSTSGTLSKSEPNTRSNSSENLRRLKPSASWEDAASSSNTREDVACPGCDKVFPPSMHLQFLDHFEFCQTTCQDRPFNF